MACLYPAFSCFSVQGSEIHPLRKDSRDLAAFSAPRALLAGGFHVRTRPTVIRVILSALLVRLRFSRSSGFKKKTHMLRLN